MEKIKERILNTFLLYIYKTTKKPSVIIEKDKYINLEKLNIFNI
jgi:hypothetical protein